MFQIAVEDVATLENLYGQSSFHEHERVGANTAANVMPVWSRHECGNYYAIDLGGTNLRVLYTRLGKGPKEVVRSYPPNMLCASSSELCTGAGSFCTRVKWECDASCLQEAEAINSAPIPPEMQSCPVEELMDYVAGHLIDWSEQHHW